MRTANYTDLRANLKGYIDSVMEVCQNAHLFFYAQSPDFHKQGLCYYLKILYL